MIITPCPHGLEELLGKSSAPRSGGLHMSTIYNDLYSGLEPKRFDKSKPMDPLRLEAGLALEEMLEEGLRKRLRGPQRPGEFVNADGIAFSPDLIIFNGSVKLGEIKLTWMSSKGVPREPGGTFPQKFDKYFTQMQCYCHALETSHARLIAFFVNGQNYFKGRAGQPGDPQGYGPELLAWDIEFSAREIREGYQMVLNHARHRGML
jgi:hypothetical protein